MVAAGHTLSPNQSEIVSPELVLVDPRLATDARGRLPGPDDTRFEDEPSLDSAEPPLPVDSVEAGSSSDEEFAAALRRITELSEVEPTKRRSLRSVVVSRLRRRGASDF